MVLIDTDVLIECLRGSADASKWLGTRGVRLYTFNLKHFQIVAGLDVQQPYQRP